MRQKSPLRVRCRELLFGFKACDWQPVAEMRGAEFVSRKARDESAIVHRSTKYTGKWQVSFFDDRGPVRDSQHSSLPDALKEVSPKRWKLKSFG